MMKYRIAIAVTATLLTAGMIGCAGDKTSNTEKASIAASVAPSSLMQRVRPSLVAVRYTWDGEMGRREIEAAGIVVSGDGLVAFTSGIVPPQISDSQIINFKIVLPPDADNPEETELDGIYLGRDERSELAFVKVKDPAERTWTPLQPTNKPLQVGDTVYTVGLLGKGSGYSTYFRQSQVSSILRGPTPLILTDGKLAAVGSPAFNIAGEFVAIVPMFTGQSPILAEDGDTQSLAAPPFMLVPISDYLPTLNDPPTALNGRKIPWLGVQRLTGLKKEVAEVYGLKGRVGIQVVDVVPNAPADKAGLKPGQIITQLNGEDLERGDTPDELPAILGRKLARMNVGDTVELTVIAKKGDEPTPIKLTLEERPAIASTAARFYAEDLGFTVRDIVFQDRYQLRVDDEFTGVAVTFVKPQGNAQAGGLQNRDIVTKINQTEITSVEQFKKDYETFRKDQAKDAVVLEVLRGVDTQIIRIQPPQ